MLNAGLSKVNPRCVLHSFNNLFIPLGMGINEVH